MWFHSKDTRHSWSDGIGFIADFLPNLFSNSEQWRRYDTKMRITWLISDRTGFEIPDWIQLTVSPIAHQAHILIHSQDKNNNSRNNM